VKILGLLFLFTLSQYSFAAYDPCKYLKFNNCGGSGNVSKSVGSSQPSSTRAFSAPSSLGSFRGFGVESIFWRDADFSIVTGTGRVGAGASSSNSDNTFFGNSSKEEYNSYVDRISKRKKYDFKKYSFATGVSLLKNKKKSLFALNIGLMGKYIESTSNFHGGAGISAGIGPLNFGASRYKDEGVNFSLTSGVETPLEYYVNTFSVGLVLPFVSIDYTIFENQSSQKDKVKIFSSAIFIHRFIFSYGHRKEDTPLPTVRPGAGIDNGASDYETNEFGGVQYKIGKHFLLGVLYNYYLSDEVSGVATLFF
jgi:hypothetical protein